MRAIFKTVENESFIIKATTIPNYSSVGNVKFSLPQSEEVTASKYVISCNELTLHIFEYKDIISVEVIENVDVTDQDDLNYEKYPTLIIKHKDRYELVEEFTTSVVHKQIYFIKALERCLERFHERR